MASSQRKLLKAADRQTPAFRRAFVNAVLRARRGAPAERLRGLIEAGRSEEAYRAALQAWERASAEWQIDVAVRLRSALEAGGQVAADSLGGRGGPLRGEFTMRFDVTDPRATAWAREHSATLVREVTLDTQRAIRGVITRALDEQRTPQQTARDLRDTIGLLHRQEIAVANFRAELEALAQRPAGAVKNTNLQRLSNRNLGAARREQLVARYRTRLLNERATMIARTEILAASNRGALEGWRQARDRGELPPGFGKVWITTPDERLCPVCAPLDDVVVGLDEPFVTARGSVMVPPLHPRCRCTVGLAEVRARRRSA